MKTLYEKKLSNGVFTIFDEKPPHAICVNQTHSNIVLNYCGEALDEIEADGVILNYKEFPEALLAIKTADCLPVCFIGDNQIAMIHAGWRGLASEVLIQPEILAIKPHTVFIGPSIQVDQFEVTEEFRENFPGDRHFKKAAGKLFFNLQAHARSQIVEKYRNIDIIDCKVCTFLSPELQSYRRDKNQNRNWNTYKIT